LHPCPTRGAAIAAVLCLALAGCTAPVPEQPLDPEALLASVRSARERAPSPHPLTLAEAVDRMRRHDPAIREARAAWQAAAAVARVPTPPPNPSLSLGPLLVGGGDILSNGAAGLDAALGWAVELGNPRALQDDLKRVRADTALARAAAVEREAYLGLRADYVAAALERDRASARTELAERARAAVDVGRRLAEAGQATAVDVRLLELDAERTFAEAVAADGVADARRHALAARVGLAAEHVQASSAQQLPPPPGEAPTLADLETAAVAHDPQLAVLRAEYVEAEKELRLEVARAMPDFEMGVGYENEDGAVKLGLPFSIELPLWDRNQPGIAAACARRSEIRVRYTAALQRLLADVAGAHARLVAAQATHEALHSRVEPASQRTLTAARAGLDAGSIDALRYLEVLRARREVAVDLLAARIALYAAWTDLEGAAGVPLLRFPDEPVAAAPEAKED